MANIPKSKLDVWNTREEVSLRKLAETAFDQVSLDALTDVDVLNPDDGDILIYDENLGIWINGPNTGSGSPSVGLEDTLQTSDGSGGFKDSGIAALAQFDAGALSTKGRLDLVALNPAGTGLRYVGVVHNGAQPVFGNGFTEFSLLHTGNVKTVGGESIFGAGDISVGGGGSPAGSGTELQYRNSGSFGAITGTAWDGTILTLPNQIRATTGLQLKGVGGTASLYSEDADGDQAAVIVDAEDPTAPVFFTKQGVSSVARTIWHSGNFDPSSKQNTITPGTGLSFSGATLNLSANLQGWNGITISSKQDTLVSGTNIKTVNGNSLLGSGDLVISGGGGDTFISTGQRWGHVQPSNMAGAGGALYGTGCFGIDNAGGTWVNSDRNTATSPLLFTLGWARRRTAASLNSAVALHVSAGGDGGIGTRFLRKNSASSSYEGFFYILDFALAGRDFVGFPGIKSDYRFFCGISQYTGNASGSGSSPNVGTTQTIGSFLNCIGIGKDQSDANWQLFHNDDSGTATKTDLGSGLAATTIEHVPFRLRINCPRGATTATYSLVRLDTSATVASGTISTDLPVANQTLCPLGYINTGSATTTEVSLYVGRVFMITDWIAP